VLAFWTGVPVAGASGAGVVPTCPGAGAVVGAIVGVLAVLTNTTQVSAKGIAAGLIAATLTVQAPLTLPPAGPIPTPIA